MDTNSLMANISDLIKYGSIENRDKTMVQQDEQLKSEQDNQNNESDLQFKQKKNQIDILQKLVKLFDSGKKKKNPDGTDIDEPNPVLELLKNNFDSVIGEYITPTNSMATPVKTELPQEYISEPEIDPYKVVEPQKNSVATNINDIVGDISDKGQDYLNNGSIQDYLKRFLYK